MPNRNEFGQQYGRHEEDRWRGADRGDDFGRDENRSRDEARYGAQGYDREYGAVRGRDDDRYHEGGSYSGSSSQRDSSSSSYRSHDPDQGYGWQGGYGDQGQSGYGGQYHRMSGRAYWQGRQTHSPDSYQGGYRQRGGYGQWPYRQMGDDRFDRQYGQSGHPSGYAPSGYGRSYGSDVGRMSSQDYRSREYDDMRRDDEGEHRGLLQRAGEWIERKIGKAPKGYTRSDERIREDVCDRIMARWEVDASEVEIQVKDGEVILSGVVIERGDKRAIEDIAEGVLGVKDVTNHIKVKSSHDNRMSDESSRTAGAATTGTRPRASS